ncbi:MAG: hypothetical protein QNK23_11365 [Crocinitomicaceae bacterium]|nr:hypothetical protein [Crocinitomicaceae bacterium]
MKKIRFTLILILFLPNLVISQVLEDDSLLLQVVQELPPGWTAKIVDSVFSIEYEDSTWAAHGNWINAPEEVWELKNDSVWIMAYGEKIKMIFEFLLVDKMDVQSIEEMKRSNPTYAYNRIWHRSIYNSQNFTLLESARPPLDNEWYAVWPKDSGGDVYTLLLKHLSLNEYH